MVIKTIINIQKWLPDSLPLKVKRHNKKNKNSQFWIRLLILFFSFLCYFQIFFWKYFYGFSTSVFL